MLTGRRKSTVGALVALACAAAVLPGCSSGDHLPNVVLITLDTMRADHLGCYGYERNTSPRIDAFAGAATLYTRAVASSPWTIPTHASLFTGRYPFEHGAHTFHVTKPINNVNPLHGRHFTIAEAFEERGYTTGAFVANEAFLSRRWQLDQGFRTYHVEGVFAERLNRRIFDWLDAHRGERFFLFVNFMDTHRPYNTTPRLGLLAKPAVRDRGELLDRLYIEVMPGEGEIPESLVQGVIDQYDTAVANVDEQIGVLIDRLASEGLYDNTLIVLTSDHGEFFGEHHLVEHSKDIYQEVLRVPLIIKNPGQNERRVVETPTSSTDIPSLIFSQFPSDLAVRYLKKFPDAPGNHVVISENYYTRTKDLFHPRWGHRFDRVRTAVFDWPYKYIRSSDDRHELYNLEADPVEADNLVGREPEVAERLATKLQRFQKSRPRAEERVEQPALTEEEIKKLKSLGYIGN